MAFETAENRCFISGDLNNNYSGSFIPKGFLLDEDFKEPSTEGSRVAKFYEQRYVFVTGATGFLGKLLVEKLLRTCPDIGGIFVLARMKKGMDFHTRLDDIYNDILFDRLKRTFPKFRHKIIAVQGDVALPNLGINDSDRKHLSEKVSVIFHGAATVRFDEPLKTAAEINVQGTVRLLELAKECKKLTSLVHISTAFANCNFRHIEERLYDLPIASDEFIDIVSRLSDKELDAKMAPILNKWPNTYTFTKSVAEDVLKKQGAGLPICIFRPAVVIATYNEPLKGWIDNLYGPIGVMVGVGTGVIRVFYSNANYKAEIVPADFVINATIVAAFKTGITRPTNEISVYNYVSTRENPIKWKDVNVLAQKHGLLTPSIRTVWYIMVLIVHNSRLFSLLSFLLHTIPAFLADTAATLMNKKPQFLKLYRKINYLVNILSYFSTSEWTFTNKNVQKLWQECGEVDKKLYPFSMKSLSWDDYFKFNLLGIRTYLLKEEFSTLTDARKKLKRLYYLHKAVQAALLYVSFRIIYLILSMLLS